MKENTADILKKPGLYKYRAVIGFDASYDVIARVVKSKNGSDTQYFSRIEEFGEYLVSKKELSCALEVEPFQRKIGGNMPILSSALSNLGVGVHSVGALGYPHVSSIFESFALEFTGFSIGEPSECLALEFEDGKVMLFQNTLHEISWERIKETIGCGQLIEVFNQADIFGLLNWSEIKKSNEIWQGLLAEVLPFLNAKKRLALFDFADCSMSDPEELRTGLSYVHDFQKYATVVLSLNENEAERLFSVLKEGEENNAGEAEGIGGFIRHSLEIDHVVIHKAKAAFAWSRAGHYVYESEFYTPTPKVSTGGGDNFNAGLCAGLMLGMEMGEVLRLASAVSAFYVQSGKSPEIEELLGFIKEKKIT